MRIVQIVPEVRAGSGVEGVAYALEQAFRRRGVATERFTLAEAGAGWLRLPEGQYGRIVVRALRTIWFSTVGTIRARRFLARRPDAVAVCHNDVLAGEVYVNHGIVRAAMRARGRFAWRMVRNPLHLFTTARDVLRYRGGVHRVVVNLTEGERRLLVHTYPRLRPAAVVIPNGVDIQRFHPVGPAERAVLRGRLGLPVDRTLAVFVGHEFDRKGLPLALAALVDRPGTDLVVVGGTPAMIAAARHRAVTLGVAERVHFVGRQDDPVPWIQAGDVFVLPSAYEANALVLLEALACGLPVIATRVGFAPDLLDGRNGLLIDRDAGSLATALRRLDELPEDSWRTAARATAECYSWDAVAGRYLELVEALRAGTE
ncbi:glycosyltransferase family 4 protein [Raineyella sp. LH-20]|uniref:glycosyltransferase family 4 protein n=1 Tax=Raineyella sp. LH-20 TaxID=3081204 RepID=UPI00295323CA|nr:glycosyltransferase family 4 protein [Raineyella sp. LH-20]WOP17204.1 glycosyltransferase family 4 protein [Raineyella sp. LH-20]